MKRTALIALLALGAIAGYASGFRSLAHAHARRAAWERHVAELCVDAARGSDGHAQKRAPFGEE